MSTKTIDIESLGFSKEELQDRIVQRCCDQVMRGVTWDDEGDEHIIDSSLARKMRERVKKQIDDSINALAEKHILPNVAQYIETLTLQETNRWGEKQAKPVTFIEYLVQRAEAYLTEKVDMRGKDKTEERGGYWNGTQTRITYMVDQHLHFSIKTAMEQAIKGANDVLANGIAETVKLKLAEISKSLKVDVKAGR